MGRRLKKNPNEIGRSRRGRGEDRGAGGRGGRHDPETVRALLQDLISRLAGIDGPRQGGSQGNNRSVDEKVEERKIEELLNKVLDAMEQRADEGRGSDDEHGSRRGGHWSDDFREGSVDPLFFNILRAVRDLGGSRRGRSRGRGTRTGNQGESGEMIGDRANRSKGRGRGDLDLNELLQALLDAVGGHGEGRPPAMGRSRSVGLPGPDVPEDPELQEAIERSLKQIRGASRASRLDAASIRSGLGQPLFPLGSSGGSTGPHRWRHGHGGGEVYAPPDFDPSIAAGVSPTAPDQPMQPLAGFAPGPVAGRQPSLACSTDGAQIMPMYSGQQPTRQPGLVGSTSGAEPAARHPAQQDMPHPGRGPQPRPDLPWVIPPRPTSDPQTSTLDLNAQHNIPPWRQQHPGWGFPNNPAESGRSRPGSMSEVPVEPPVNAPVAVPGASTQQPNVGTPPVGVRPLSAHGQRLPRDAAPPRAASVRSASSYNASSRAFAAQPGMGDPPTQLQHPPMGFRGNLAGGGDDGISAQGAGMTPSTATPQGYPVPGATPGGPQMAHAGRSVSGSQSGDSAAGRRYERATQAVPQYGGQQLCNAPTVTASTPQSPHTPEMGQSQGPSLQIPRASGTARQKPPSRASSVHSGRSLPSLRPSDSSKSPARQGLRVGSRCPGEGGGLFTEQNVSVSQQNPVPMCADGNHIQNWIDSSSSSGPPPFHQVDADVPKDTASRSGPADYASYVSQVRRPPQAGGGSVASGIAGRQGSARSGRVAFQQHAPAIRVTQPSSDAGAASMRSNRSQVSGTSGGTTSTVREALGRGRHAHSHGASFQTPIAEEPRSYFGSVRSGRGGSVHSPASSPGVASRAPIRPGVTERHRGSQQGSMTPVVEEAGIQSESVRSSKSGASYRSHGSAATPWAAVPSETGSTRARQTPYPEAQYMPTGSQFGGSPPMQPDYSTTTMPEQAPSAGERAPMTFSPPPSVASRSARSSSSKASSSTVTGHPQPPSWASRPSSMHAAPEQTYYTGKQPNASPAPSAAGRSTKSSSSRASIARAPPQRATWVDEPPHPAPSEYGVPAECYHSAAHPAPMASPPPPAAGRSTTSRSSNPSTVQGASQPAFWPSQPPDRHTDPMQVPPEQIHFTSGPASAVPLHAGSADARAVKSGSSRASQASGAAVPVMSERGYRFPHQRPPMASPAPSQASHASRSSRESQARAAGTVPMPAPRIHLQSQAPWSQVQDDRESSIHLSVHDAYMGGRRRKCHHDAEDPENDPAEIEYCGSWEDRAEYEERMTLEREAARDSGA